MNDTGAKAQILLGFNGPTQVGPWYQASDRRL